MIARRIAHALCALLSLFVFTHAKADRLSATNNLEQPLHDRAIKITGETGMASIYAYAGDKTAGGNKTANGERVSVDAMTAAHKTLALGSKVRVTNLANGRSAVVRINDRGPFVKGRVIDLTPAAAEALGFSVNEGTA